LFVGEGGPGKFTTRHGVLEPKANSPATTAALVSLEGWLGHNPVPNLRLSFDVSSQNLRFNLNNRKSHVFSGLDVENFRDPAQGCDGITPCFIAANPPPEFPPPQI
jgi:hypothetical protein